MISMLARGRARLIGCAVWSLVLASCADVSNEPIGSATEAVISGTADTTGSYSAVARMNTNCSGVLIAPRVVLTSQHCFTAHATGCTTLAMSPINVTFAETTGGYSSTQSITDRRVGVQGFALHPGAAFQLGSCPAPNGCGTTLERAAIDHSREQMLLFLSKDPPFDVKPLPVMLHPTVYNQVANGGFAGTFGKFANIQTWANNNHPVVTFVGTGIGTQQYTTQNFPGRDIGHARWIATLSDYDGFNGMTSCTADAPLVFRPVVAISPDDIFGIQAPSGGWDNVTPGFDFPNTAHSHAGSGDSGGPVIVGLGPATKGVAPTQLPAPAAGDAYSSTGAYVIGNADLWLPDVNLRPATAYAPTYTLEASQFIAFFLADDDGDGYAGNVDTFPGCDDKGPDGDGDGIPNECDVCPCDTNNDSDGDGFCTKICPNTVVDLCPQVADFPLDNCNTIAEDANGKSRLADRCDSAICPSGFVPEATKGPDQQLPCPQNGSDLDQQCPPTSSGYVTWLNCNTYIRNKFEITPLASFDATGGSTSGGNTPTPARFCQQNDALGISCNDPAEDFQDEQIDDFGQATVAADETKFTHFHRVSFSSGGTSIPDSPHSLVYGSSPSSAPSVTWVWDYADDQSRWLAADQIDLVPGDTPLRGTFWLHAKGSKGATVNIGRGTHGSDTNNWYETGEGTFAGAFAPEAFYCNSCGFLKLPTGVGGGTSGGGWGTVEPINGGVSKTPWIVWRRASNVVAANALHRPDATKREATIVWPVDSGMGAVGTNCGSGTTARRGTAQLVNARLGSSLTAQFTNTSLRWFNSVEPVSELGAGASFPLAVALSSTGAFMDTVATDGVRLMADRDRGITRTARTGGPTAPTDGYAAVFTRVRRGVFVIANRSATGVAGGIWFTPLDGNRWRRFSVAGYTPEKVLAATYSFASDSLYILDEAAGSARLTQIRVRTGAMTRLGSWTRHADWSRHTLVVEKNGSLLLASSNPGRRIHTITRLDVRNAVGSIDGGGITRSSELFAPPVVDADGYQYLTWTGSQYGRTRERTLQMTRAIGPRGSTDLAELGAQL